MAFSPSCDATYSWRPMAAYSLRRIGYWMFDGCFQKVKKIFYFKTNIYVASGSTYISSITETL